MGKKEGKKSGSQMKGSLRSTSEAERLYRECLEKNGFDEAAPDLKTAWKAFREMKECSFDCSDDGLLFEAGEYDFTGEEVFYLSLVRQFTIEVDGEYDYMEQLRLEFMYQADEELKLLKETIWTYDFDDDIDVFLEAVENNEVYRRLCDHYKPLGFELYKEEV